MDILRGFPPVIDDTSTVLILGSMPGPASLKHQQYYGHPRNQFWPIIFTLLGRTAASDYRKKRQLLLDHGIALWDVIGSCRREGSSDGSIREIIPNDIDNLFSQYPGIAALVLNGQKAEQCYRRLIRLSCPASGHAGIRLPSTSPACTLSYREKLQAWSAVLDFLPQSFQSWGATR